MNTRIKIGIQLAITASAIIYVIFLIDFNELKLLWADISRDSLLWVLLLLSANIGIMAIRLQRVLTALGYKIPFRQVLRAHILSQIAGAFFFQLVGQTISRASLLSAWKVDASAAFVVSLVERIIAALVAGLLCTVGVVTLFGGFSRLEGIGPNYFAKCLIILMLAFLIIARTSGKDYLGWLKSNILQHIMPMQLVGAAIITFLGQAFVAFSYVVIADNLAGGTIPLAKLLNASFIIMFAAAIPISFAGWGVRELGAVWVLGAIGMPQTQAAFVAVIVGSMSILLLCGLLPLASLVRKDVHHQDDASTQLNRKKIAYNKAVLLGLPLACSCLVFFQLRLPVMGGELSINMADPVAIAMGLLAVWEFIRRRKLPMWQAPFLNAVLIAITSLLSISLLLGINRFGATPWALSNRYIGWFILLAYFVAGGLAGGFGGIGHRQGVLRTLATTGILIAACEWGLLLLKSGGVITPGTGWIGYNLEGLVQNRNAFAFQMLMVLSITLASADARLRVIRLAGIPLLITVIIWTGSRAGLLALPIVLVLAWRRRLMNFRYTALLGGIFVLIALAPYGVAGLSGGNSLQHSIQFSSPSSDSQHIQTVLSGIRMWLEYPLAGAGLGAFIREWQITYGTPLVIHNIYVWMLAETGLVGFAAFLGLLLCVLHPVLTGKKYNGFSSTEQSSVIFLITCMLIVGMFHDMLYQRIFWFAFGLFLMKPASLSETSN